MRRRSRPLLLLAALATLMVSAPGAGGAGAPSDAPGRRRLSPPAWAGSPRPPYPGERNEIPEDRYAMAGGCYALAAAGKPVTAAGDGYASGNAGSPAEPFHFQATDLGRYLLFDSSERFLSASEGVLAEVVHGITRSDPGAIANGVLLDQPRRVTREVVDSPANRATGRGANVVAAGRPSGLGNWKVHEAGAGQFRFLLPKTDQGLAVAEDGTLTVGPRDAATPFALSRTRGCAAYPEIEVNVDGPVVGGETSFSEVRGFLDAHLHMMAFEFLGGRVRCGRPWHRFGVAHALVDCPDHRPGGYGAVLEAFLTKRNPAEGHNTDGWPTFEGWPTHYSLTHEQVYYRWLERAWRGGQRMFVNLLVDNNVLCEVYPLKRNSCNEMDGVRLQARRIRQLERYIDAQNGGPGEGWFRIVTDPFEARRVMNEGNLAVVLGIEVSVPFDCGVFLDSPRCSEDQIDERVQEVYDLGVRQMEFVNKFDNALSGVKGDAGTTGVVVNTGNFLETGRFWQMDTCAEDSGHAHDHTQPNPHDDLGAPDEMSGRDSLAGGILAVTGTSGAAPLYPEGPHCNQRGLTPLGKTLITELVERGMIFDPDHMSASARHEAVDFVEELDYSGIISSHGWADDAIYRRILRMGGVVAPYAGDSEHFVERWRDHKAWADDRFLFGLGYGADTNGFGSQGAPRGADVPNPVEYPFTGLGGVEVGRQRSGTRVYDVNVDGVAHYGLYPDWIEDLRRQAGDAIVRDLAFGPEAYLQMWERALGIAPDACRSDVEDLTDAHLGKLRAGMSPEDVLGLLGQPGWRRGAAFGYCMTEGREVVLTFAPDERLHSWVARRDR